MSKYLIGIDEAGRGPLAGPVAVGVAKVPHGFDWSLVPGVGDSKGLTAKNRGAIFRRAQWLRHHQQLDFAVAMVGSSVIDAQGIVFAVELALARALARLGAHPDECVLKLDGGLKAAPQFTQEAIIKGDASEPVIGLASIVAKETRDTYMKRIARQYPNYGFAEHMGYGTKQHRAAIAQLGKTPIHRVSYCQNIKPVVTM